MVEFGTYYPQYNVSFTAGDVFRVSVESGVVKYKKNGVVYHTSSGIVTYPLKVDTALYTANSTLTNAVVGGNWSGGSGGGGSSSSEVLWLVADHLGTPRMILDETGWLTNVKRHDYLPFGEELFAGTGGRTTGQGYTASDNVRQKFTSKERDNETGLDYFLARYYSSTQGRFTSPDEFSGGPDELYNFVDAASENPTFYAELTNPQSLNKYQYTYNNPTNLTDADGHCPPCGSVITISEAAGRNPSTALDVLQLGISVVGIFVPGAGDALEVVNAGVSGMRGNKAEAAGDLLGAATGPVGSIAASANRVRKIAKAASKGDDLAEGASATRRGLASEKRVLNDIGETKNTQKVSSPEGNSVPDYQNKTTVGEIKDTRRVSNTRQVRIQRDAATASGRRHVIQTGRNTRVSQPVQKSGTVVKKRDDLGPQ